MTKYVLTLLLLCQFGVAHAAPDNRRAIVTHYTNLAHAVFDDAKTTAQTLLSRVEALLAEPSEKTLMAARQAWSCHFGLHLDLPTHAKARREIPATSRGK